MKRFAVFGGGHYYPRGGMDDFLKSFDTREEADEFAALNARRPDSSPGYGSPYEWIQVEDTEEYE